MHCYEICTSHCLRHAFRKINMKRNKLHLKHFFQFVVIADMLEMGHMHIGIPMVLVRSDKYSAKFNI